MSGSLSNPPRVDLRVPPKAPNACPECGHTPDYRHACFGGGPICRDWRGDSVLCLCTHDAHFGGGS